MTSLSEFVKQCRIARKPGAVTEDESKASIVSNCSLLIAFKACLSKFDEREEKSDERITLASVLAAAYGTVKDSAASKGTSLARLPFTARAGEGRSLSSRHLWIGRGKSN